MPSTLIETPLLISLPCRKVLIRVSSSPTSLNTSTALFNKSGYSLSKPSINFRTCCEHSPPPITRNACIMFMLLSGSVMSVSSTILPRCPRKASLPNLSSRDEIFPCVSVTIPITTISIMSGLTESITSSSPSTASSPPICDKASMAIT